MSQYSEINSLEFRIAQLERKATEAWVRVSRANTRARKIDDDLLRANAELYQAKQSIAMKAKNYIS